MSHLSLDSSHMLALSMRQVQMMRHKRAEIKDASESEDVSGAGIEKRQPPCMLEWLAS